MFCLLSSVCLPFADSCREMFLTCHTSHSHVTHHILMSHITFSCHTSHSHVTHHILMSHITFSCHKDTSPLATATLKVGDQVEAFWPDNDEVGGGGQWLLAEVAAGLPRFPPSANSSSVVTVTWLED